MKRVTSKIIAVAAATALVGAPTAYAEQQKHANDSVMPQSGSSSVATESKPYVERAERKIDNMTDRAGQMFDRNADEAKREGRAAMKRTDEMTNREMKDNTTRNARDASGVTKTPSDQAITGSDNEIIAAARRNILKNDSLSTNARNVKIVSDSRDQSITLRGPVDTAQERSWIESTVRSSVPSSYRIDNQLEVTND